jgi:hypothetical protein
MAHPLVRQKSNYMGQALPMPTHLNVISGARGQSTGGLNHRVGMSGA